MTKFTNSLETKLKVVQAPVAERRSNLFSFDVDRTTSLTKLILSKNWAELDSNTLLGSIVFIAEKLGMEVVFTSDYGEKDDLRIIDDNSEKFLLAFHQTILTPQTLNPRKKSKTADAASNGREAGKITIWKGIDRLNPISFSRICESYEPEVTRVTMENNRQVQPYLKRYITSVCPKYAETICRLYADFVELLSDRESYRTLLDQAIDWQKFSAKREDLKAECVCKTSVYEKQVKQGKKGRSLVVGEVKVTKSVQIASIDAIIGIKPCERELLKQLFVPVTQTSDTISILADLVALNDRLMNHRIGNVFELSQRKPYDAELAKIKSRLSIAYRERQEGLLKIKRLVKYRYNVLNQISTNPSLPPAQRLKAFMDENKEKMSELYVPKGYALVRRFFNSDVIFPSITEMNDGTMKLKSEYMNDSSNIKFFLLRAAVEAYLDQEGRDYDAEDEGDNLHP